MSDEKLSPRAAMGRLEVNPGTDRLFEGDADTTKEPRPATPTE